MRGAASKQDLNVCPPPIKPEVLQASVPLRSARRPVLPVVWTFLIVSYPLIKAYQSYTIPLCLLMDFPTFPFALFFDFYVAFSCKLFSKFLHCLSTLIKHISNALFPHPSCHFLQLLTTSYLQSNPTHSIIIFPANKACPAVPL